MDYPRIARRTFLGAAAVASLAPVKSFLHAEDKKKADEFGGFILGVQSYSFRNFKLEPALKKIQDLGLHYVEFYNGHVPVNSTPEQIRAVLKLCKDYDITPVAYGVEPFSKNHDENKKRFELTGDEYSSSSDKAPFHPGFRCRSRFGPRCMRDQSS